MSDVLLLHAIREKQRYKALRPSVPDEMMSPETQNMLLWFEAYWQTYPDATRVEVDPLVAMIKLRCGNASPDAVAITLHVAESLRTEPNTDAVMGVANTLYERNLSGRAGALLANYNGGGEVNLAYELQALAMEAKKEFQSGGVSSYADGPIEKYLLEDADEGGLVLDCFGTILAERIKGLRTGHNIAIAAPTDKGKTSVMCAVATSIARQAKTLYPGRPLLYLVNEGQAERILPRMWQTALQIKRQKMYEMSNAGLLVPAYEKIVGLQSNIRLKNIHGKNIAQVEQIIEHHNPYCVMTDMTGRIRAVSNRGGGANDIGQLEEVWNGMRELAAIHDFLHVGTIQVSGEGFEQLYPPLSALQNSKVGIQTTLDLILMMGAVSSLPDTRGISTPKNKLARAGHNSLTQFMTLFEPEVNTWTMQA